MFTMEFEDDDIDETADQTALEQIYEKFTPGGRPFIDAVNSHCGFCASDEEIERIAAKAKTAAEFEAIWEGQDWWTDANN